MYKQLFFWSRFLMLPVVVTVLFVACHKNDIDSHYPAWYIAESEKLVIPASVDIPVTHPGGTTRVATFFAAGVQKYKAKVKDGSNPVTYEWVLVAPDANLYNASNAKVGTHTAGPNWEISAMDSIFGQHFSPPRTAPGPEPNSVDWLLLMPKAGTTPTGIFANVAYIQRIATKGGKAPATLPNHANETVDVHYTAVYRFTRKNP